MTTTIDLADAAGLFGELNFKLYRAGLDGLFSAALRSVQAIQMVIVPSRTPQPVDRGLFRAGWRASPLRDGALIENAEPHAPFVEFGVRASSVKIGRAMINALTEWVERKRLASGKEAIEAAWAIAKAMQRRGIFEGGRGFQIQAILREWYLNRFIEEEVAAEIERALR